MKNKLVLMTSMLLWLGMFSACSSDDDTDNPIIGTWELKTLGFPGVDIEIPSDQRDVYEFCANGKVKVIKKFRTGFDDFPGEDGEYDYSYDKKKQIIQLCGVARECIISGGEMHMEGYHYGPDDGLYVHEYIFIKK